MIFKHSEDSVYTGDYLYHYTTAKALCMILSSQKLRFTSLCKLDDLEEHLTKDGDYFGQHIFACSFSSLEDSIGMWDRYGDNGQGVCIKFRNNIFDVNKTYYIHQHKILLLPAGAELVKYTNDEDKLRPRIFFHNTNSYTLESAGITKRNAWAYQQEIRYRAICFAPDYKHLDSELSFYHADIPIIPSTLNSIEIILGYRISDYDKAMVITAVNQYEKAHYVTLKILDSTAKGKVCSLPVLHN